MGRPTCGHSVGLRAQLSYRFSLIRLFNWTIVLVPVKIRWERIDLFSDSTILGGDIPCSAGFYLTFFQLAKQATHKLASR